jgi:23S rRNA (pseudouridine1915-N3)-methyltransferase
MKLRLILIGRDRHDPLCKVADDYAARICRYYPFEVIEIKETPLRGGANLDRVRADEANKITKHIKPGEYIVAMDERGKSFDSLVFAQRIEKWTHEGPSTINFVIGGPVGLDRTFLKSAHERWMLSAMTLPHRLARVVLVEQVYRACTIIRGEPYHK